MKKQVFFLFLLLSIATFSQQITGNQLLEKAIHFHDPKGNWKTFNGELFITMKTPDQIKRKSEIRINLPKEYFYIKSYKDASTEEYTVNKGICSKVLGGNKNPSNDHKKTCKRANLYKDYYTFLYGLPMKLKDEGTIVHQKVAKKIFNGKEYWVLKVTYDENVGKDRWFFYFNPKNYEMEAYQFFKKEENSGEFILLSGLEIIQEIKMPKKRDWYYNKDNRYLGTDLLSIK
ncbi:MAG: DUF6503 family protein [Polaribacter sp.]|nr:DUF6503 family protein [Polaribacter sp.]